MTNVEPRCNASMLSPKDPPVHTSKLADLQAQLDVRVVQEYAELIAKVPSAVRRRHANIAKEGAKRPINGLKFSRPDFVRDVLFSEDGFGLIPTVFTKSTQKLEEHEQIPSTSAKDHLPYFTDEPFVPMLMDYQRLEKMRGTYVGKPAHFIPGKTEEDPEIEVEATGFWKYIHNGYIHPSFLLHRTVTGRSSSANPNAQNFPKRGRGGMKEVVKAFRRVFEAPPGWKIIEADLSQAELRVAAWMANERTMIDLYCNGGDIHSLTAARTMGLNMDQFAEWTKTRAT